MLSRNAKSFQRKSGRESSMKGTRSRKTPATAFTLQPTSHPSVLIHSFPLGTFNGIKLWARESNNNHLGLKHNTLTGLTRPFSPPLLAQRRGHLLLLLRNRAHWLSDVTSSVINRWRVECRLTRRKNISFKVQKVFRRAVTPCTGWKRVKMGVSKSHHRGYLWRVCTNTNKSVTHNWTSASVGRVGFGEQHK